MNVALDAGTKLVVDLPPQGEEEEREWTALLRALLSDFQFVSMSDFRNSVLQHRFGASNVMDFVNNQLVGDWAEFQRVVQELPGGGVGDQQEVLRRKSRDFRYHPQWTGSDITPSTRADDPPSPERWGSRYPPSAWVSWYIMNRYDREVVRGPSG